MRKKAIAVIIKDDKVLLMRRIKDGRQFFVLPGGGVKIKENLESAAVRVIREEFDLEIKIDTFLFRMENQGRTEFYFLVKSFEGEPRISGEIRQIINENNQYHLQWKKLNTLDKLSSLRPTEARKKIQRLLSLVG